MSWRAAPGGVETRLRAEMIAQNFTVEGLAEAAGVSASTLSEWRLARFVPGGRSMLQVADALGVAVEDLWRLSSDAA